MAQTDIIQKDLGLVTAYGYALAGGYQGTEEQFKIDFANLMAGKYSGSEIKYTGCGQTGYVEEFRNLLYNSSGSSSQTQYVSSGIWTYGNMSFITVSCVAIDDITISVNSYAPFAQMSHRAASNSMEYFKYIPVQTFTKPKNTPIYSHAEIIGLARYLNNSLGNTVSVQAEVWQNNGYYMIYELVNETNSAITIESGTSITIEHLFMNRVGIGASA